MPTVSSWTEETSRTLEDVAALVRFRMAGVRGPARRRVRIALVVLALLTVGSVLGPTWLSAEFRAGTPMVVRYLPEPAQVRDLLPAGLAWFLVLTAGSAVATGGGRELIARERAVAYPLGPGSDHLGALLLAPLSLAWLLQAWLLLGSTTYAGGWGALPGVPLVLLWLAAATAVGQVAGWMVEALRRGPRGVLLSRGLLVLMALVGAVLLAARKLDELVAWLPTTAVAEAAVEPGWSWVPVLVVEIVVLVAAVVAGLGPARIAARRPPREEHRLDSGVHPARPVDTGSDSWFGDLRMLLRVDRAAVWRSVPLRRGVMVMALLPGLAGLAAGLSWSLAVILPGLVASGVALLFGVNAWSLDGRGALWRESLPADPTRVFLARSVVLVELIGVSGLVTLVLLSLRAGIPDLNEAVALACAWLVAPVQVTAVAASWSVRHPYAVDLRSSRATPAPPGVMVGYSARLALSCTLIGMVFSALAQLPLWWLSVSFATLFLAWSAVRMTRAHTRWTDPGARARVVATVAA